MLLSCCDALMICAHFVITCSDTTAEGLCWLAGMSDFAALNELKASKPSPCVTPLQAAKMVPELSDFVMVATVGSLCLMVACVSCLTCSNSLHGLKWVMLLADVMSSCSCCVCDMNLSMSALP